MPEEGTENAGTEGAGTPEPAGGVQPDAGGDSGGSAEAAPAVPAAPAGEGEPGSTPAGGAGGESGDESSPAPESGSDIPETTGEDENPPAEEATPTAPVEAVGNGPTQPSSNEQPTAGLPTGEELAAKDAAAEAEDESAIEKLKTLGDEALDEAKEIGRVALGDAIEKSRDYISTLLKSENMTPEQAAEVKRLYIAGEKHAVKGKVAVSQAMAKRINNYIKTHRIVIRSEKARATDNYLGSIWTLVTGAVGTFVGAFGGPLVDSLTDIGLTAVDEFLQ